MRLTSSAHQWERIWLLARIEFKLRYYESKLGLLWALIKPASQIVMYYLVFQILMRQGVENYAIYLWSGLFIWQFFVETTSGTIKVLEVKKYLYLYTNMNKVEIYLSYMVSSSIGLFINFAIFCVGAAISGVPLTYHYLLFLLLYINLFLLGFGVSLMLSTLYLLFKDISQVWGIVVSFGFFLSPILYRDDLFETRLPWLNYLNPISGIINNTRDVLVYGRMLNWNMILFDMGYALLLVLIGFWMLRKLGSRAAELV